MALTPWRWLGVAIVGCLVAGTIASRSRLRPTREPDPRARFERSFREAGRSAADATDRLRLVQVHDSITRSLKTLPATDTSRLVIARDLPPWSRNPITALHQRAASYRPQRPVRPVDLVVLYDTMSTLRGVPRGRSDRIEIDYALPAAAGDRCMVLVRIRYPLVSEQSARISRYLSSAASGPRLLGPCGFYEWFGNPGPGIDAWLRDGAWTFGTQSGQWHRSVAQMDFRDYWWSFRGFAAADAGWPLRDFVTPQGYRCLSGDESMCSDLVQNASREPELMQVWGSRFVSPGRILGRFWWRRTYELGPAESRILAYFVHRLGPERFQSFWKSGASPDSAFRQASGVSMGSATLDWGRQVYDEANRGPGLGGTALASSVILGFAAIGLAIRAARRRRVV